jgi:hypothetical protein
MPDLNIPDHDPRDLDGTQPGKPIGIPSPLPPQGRPALPPRPPKEGAKRSDAKSDQTPPRGTRIYREKRRNDAPRRVDRRNSGWYLPAWSLALMLLFVIGVSFGILLLVFAVGGRFEAGGEPVVVIITAVPSSTPPVPQFAPTLPLATLPGINPSSAGQLSLLGPTLVPVVLSPTPIAIQIGSRVQTTGEAVRVRPAPNLDNVELFFTEANEEFVVTEGPEQGSGLTWWRVQDADDPTRAGWIAANLITAVAAP